MILRNKFSITHQNDHNKSPRKHSKFTQAPKLRHQHVVDKKTKVALSRKNRPIGIELNQVLMKFEVDHSPYC
ncbi:hypothetical protein CBX96_09605 [Shewanella sp. BC20]|nr:hypothetical protein CBX96_09605 [Shewanella sp. BC20]